MAIGANLDLGQATEFIANVHESDPDRSFLIICETGVSSLIAKQVADELSIEPPERFEIDVSDLVHQTKVEFQTMLGNLIHSRSQGLLLVKGVEKATHDIAQIIGTVLGDRHISDRSIVAEDLPAGWIFLVSGIPSSVDSNPLIKNSGFLDRFSIIRVNT